MACSSAGEWVELLVSSMVGKWAGGLVASMEWTLAVEKDPLMVAVMVVMKEMQ